MGFEMKTRRLFMSTFAAGLCSVAGFADDASGAVEVTIPEAVTAEVVQEESYEVTFEFVDTRIQDVLSIMAEQRPNTSILIGPEVQGNVTLNLKKVPWLKALDLILKQHGLVYENISENIFEIKVSEVPEVTAKADVKIVLYEMSEIVNMDSKELFKLYSKLADARADVTTEQMRSHIIENGKVFIKELVADNQQAVKILKVLANDADLNFSFSGVDKVTTKAEKGAPATASAFTNRVSLRLRRMPLEKVLTMVCNKGGLSCLYKDDVWEISPRRPEQQRPLVIGHFDVKFLAVDNELLAVLRSMISERGKITAGKNKILIVKATEEEQEAIRNTLAVMDKPTPQVMIEARFFELADGESSHIGIDWSAALGGETGQGMTVSASGKTDFKDTMYTPNQVTSEPGNPTFELKPGVSQTNVDDWIAKNKNLDETFDTEELFDQFYRMVPGTAGVKTYEGLERITTGSVGYAGFSATLRALNADSGAQQLANPKIVVTSGEQATIHIGAKEPIIKSSSSGSGESAERTYELDSNFGNADTNKIANLTGEEGEIEDVFNAQGTPGYLDLGTILTVAPTVKTEDQVYIKVIPNLMRQTGQITIAGNTYPRLFSTKVYTEFTINSGQTIAIGGLTKEQEVNATNKVPLLGDIPLIGKYLFSYESNERERSETVIFLTVNVVGAKDLKTTSGIPINSKLVDPVLETIRLQDTQGAEYIPQSQQAQEQEIVPAEEGDLEDSSETEVAEEVEAEVAEVEEVTEPEPVIATEEEVIVIE